EMRALVQERPRAGEIGDVRARLTREDGIARETELLRALDLRVPVGALDEADRNHAMPAASELLEPLNHEPRPTLVSLHGDTEVARAVRERAALEHVLEYSERQPEAVCFLRVDRHRGPRFRRGHDEALELLGDLRHCAPALRVLVARMKGRELDRDA